MPTPNVNTVHINRPLTNLSVAYIQDYDQFIASQVFPTVPVSSRSDIYYTYNRGDFNRGGLRKRAEGTESQGGDWGNGTNTYFTNVWALHHDVGDQTRANADEPLDMDADTTAYLTNQGLLTLENSFIQQYMSTNSTWTVKLNGTAGTPGAGTFLKWSDPNSTPIETIRAQMTAMQRATGLRPNTLTLSQDVWDALEDHPDIVDRIKYGQTPVGPAVVDTSALAKLLKIKRVLVAGAVINTAAEGQPENNQFLAQGTALLTYSADAPGLRKASAGYLFTWKGYLNNANNYGLAITKFRMEHLKADRIEIEMAYDMRSIANDLGTLFLGAV